MSAHDREDFEPSQNDYVYSTVMNPLYDRQTDPGIETNNHYKNEGMTNDTSCKSIDKPEDRTPHFANYQEKCSEKELLDAVKGCPVINCAERLVICLDISDEMDKATFKSKAGDKFPPLRLVKRALGVFIHTKHRLNPAHQFALVLLRDKAFWVCDFTNSPDKIITIMNEMKDTSSYEKCDLTSVFDQIQTHATLPKLDNPSIEPPPYIVRVVLVYGRSHCPPTFSSYESLKALSASPHFFFDCYYIHEPPSQENQCEDIFNHLCVLDTRNQSYIFEVSRNPTKLYDQMAQLLAHPLQRPQQSQLNHSIEIRADTPPR